MGRWGDGGDGEMREQNINIVSSLPKLLTLTDYWLLEGAEYSEQDAHTSHTPNSELRTPNSKLTQTSLGNYDYEDHSRGYWDFSTRRFVQ